MKPKRLIKALVHTFAYTVIAISAITAADLASQLLSTPVKIVIITLLLALLYINCYWREEEKKKPQPRDTKEEPQTFWLARDEDGALWQYENRPKKNSRLGVWWNRGNNTPLDRGSFPAVQWTDPEPTEIEITIKKNEQ